MCTRHYAYKSSQCNARRIIRCPLFFYSESSVRVGCEWNNKAEICLHCFGWENAGVCRIATK